MIDILGFLYRKTHPDEDYSKIIPDQTLSNHDCNTCDCCLSRFFMQYGLAGVVDIRAVLNDKRLHEAIVAMYQCAMQYLYVNRLLTLRLAIKAAWNDPFRHGSFDSCFYSLDRFTVNLQFPRLTGSRDVSQRSTENEGCNKRQRVESDGRKVLG